MPPVCFLRVATLQLAVCQRGQPKVEKGEGLIKPDKNRHSLPLFPLRFSPLDSPFLNPLFPHLCRFLPASFPDTQESADPYQPVAGNNSGAWLSTETGSFPLYVRKCFTKSKCCCRDQLSREWTKQGEYEILKEKAKRRKSHEKSNNRRK